MKKLFLILATAVMCIFMISCTETDAGKDAVVWNDIDLTYWQENDMSGGSFTSQLIEKRKCYSANGLSREIVQTLLETDISATEIQDYFSYVEEKEYKCIALINSSAEYSIYFVFTDDNTVLAIFEISQSDIENGVLQYPQPKIYSVNNVDNISALFEKYYF